jgi:thymidylate synthase (FAD)
MKHQVGCAWNEISGRYVVFEPDFYVPENWREQHESNKQGSKGAISDQKAAATSYEAALKDQFDTYNELLAMGVCKEQARMILPVATYSECYWTTSLQAIMHFLSLRLDGHSQWETRQYAAACYALVRERFRVSLELMELPDDLELPEI